ncbi:UDP-2,4-diacetamido-2,4,6-trideoxy-beta-L-altropyranose hydrolase [Marinobacter mobilis]|uniref:UDP-2,4-diacetamido-2,4,6-trideoxy-beta-L-altropyranose hydrolase n=2 Tax=Marinobacter mobilis TaxID=488533 RepID=A0A1H2TK81_9GAMM|nr:UDP-2,4-diacetamido-2,4,6-trideoxy-beta-L-altropyranose hydrolase [Marinobacter mobilis]
MRCLALASAFENLGLKSEFLCRAHEGNLISLIRQSGFPVTELAVARESTAGCSEYESWLGANVLADAEDSISAMLWGGRVWVVADHYGIDERWEQAVSGRAGRIIVIDDLANRAHQCDFLVDSSYKRTATDYINLVPPDCQVLAGTRYCLLRAEFSEFRQRVLPRLFNMPPRHILVSLGGIDRRNFTSLIIDELETTQLPDSVKVDVVIGHASPYREMLEERSRSSRLCVSINQGVNDMARRLVSADICVGAVGSSVWERCCLGCPSFVAILADNQKEGAQKLQSDGVVQTFSPTARGELRALVDGVARLTMQHLSENGRRLVDGLGVQRVVKAILEQ